MTAHREIVRINWVTSLPRIEQECQELQINFIMLLGRKALVVSNLRLETNSSQFESGCYERVKVSSLQ